MGIDVEIAATGDLSSPVDDIAGYLELRWQLYVGGGYGKEYETIEISRDKTEAYFVTMERWYGPGYERGEWPRIYARIRLMQHVFPHADIYYGSDLDREVCCSENLCTPERLEQLWMHYLGPDGDSYRRQ